MTLEISPVLAGTFDTPNYAPAANNLASQQTDNIGSVDTRRYTKFDRSATEAGSTTDFSFSDFLDLINPLEHIPVLSSIYREVTGESINPVSRVAGDILYGGMLGMASAVMGGLGAAGDSIVEAQTGKDATGNVVAALFGTDSPASPAATTQLAQADSQSSSTVAAAIPALPSPPAVPALPNTNLASATPPPGFIPLAGLKMTAAQQAVANTSTDPQIQAQTQALLAAKAFPVDPQKMAFGGIMDPSSLQGSNMALAMAAHAPGLQIGNMVYPGRLTPGTRHTALGTPVPATGSTSAVAPVTSATPPAAPATANATLDLPPQVSTNQNPLPPELMQDIAALRAVHQYKSTASQSTPAGSSVNVIN